MTMPKRLIWSLTFMTLKVKSQRVNKLMNLFLLAAFAI